MLFKDVVLKLFPSCARAHANMFLHEPRFLKKENNLSLNIWIVCARLSYTRQDQVHSGLFQKLLIRSWTLYVS
jgi:hypothetical protein